MFKHILLPIDGSDLSLRAARLGIELARTCGARVQALHVIPPFHTISYIAETLATTEIAYTQDATKRGEAYLAVVKRMAEAAELLCATGYAFDDHPHQVILRTVLEQHCDLVVMGSHGWRGLTRLLLGSEVHKVLLESQIPVLVCR
jgi:nucleotide-binding universal stress UspA family protein